MSSAPTVYQAHDRLRAQPTSRVDFPKPGPAVTSVSRRDRALFAADYFDKMYELAEDLVPAGKAYVDHLSDEAIKEYRGS